MTLERMCALVTAWVRFYTRRLPSQVHDRRVAEIVADMYDQVAFDRARGVADSRITRLVASRMIRGITADLTWRRKQVRTSGLGSPMKGLSMLRGGFPPAARIAVGVAVVLAIPLVGMIASNQVDWSLGDFALAGGLLTVIGVAIELAARRRGNAVMASLIAACGIAAAVLGNADDAPGLVVLGILLTASGGVLGLRTLQSSR